MFLVPKATSFETKYPAPCEDWCTAGTGRLQYFPLLILVHMQQKYNGDKLIILVSTLVGKTCSKIKL